MDITNKAVKISRAICRIEESLANGDLLAREADDLRIELEELKEWDDLLNAYFTARSNGEKLQAERDALVDKVQHFQNQYEISESVVKALTGQKGMLMQEVRQLKANNSDLSVLLERQVRLSNKLSIAMAGHRKIFTDKQIMLADEHLASHDAEVAKAAYLAGGLRWYNLEPLDGELESTAEQYAASLSK